MEAEDGDVVGGLRAVEECVDESFACPDVESIGGVRSTDRLDKFFYGDGGRESARRFSWPMGPASHPHIERHLSEKVGKRLL